MITDVDQLPAAQCEDGYPISQLKMLMDEQQFRRLMQWMTGQTMMLCEGRSYNHDTKEYEIACNGEAHGTVIYAWDLERFIRGGQIID